MIILLVSAVRGEGVVRRLRLSVLASVAPPTRKLTTIHGPWMWLMLMLPFITATIVPVLVILLRSWLGPSPSLDKALELTTEFVHLSLQLPEHHPMVNHLLLERNVVVTFAAKTLRLLLLLRPKLGRVLPSRLLLVLCGGSHKGLLLPRGLLWWWNKWGWAWGLWERGRSLLVRELVAVELREQTAQCTQRRWSVTTRTHTRNGWCHYRCRRCRCHCRHVARGACHGARSWFARERMDE